MESVMRPDLPEIQPPEEMDENIRIINPYTRKREGRVYGKSDNFVVPLDTGSELVFSRSDGENFDIILVKPDEQRIPYNGSIGRHHGMRIRSFLTQFD